MTLRARLALAFALFAAVPLAATFWPVSRALSRSLEAEHGARLEASTRAIEGEVAHFQEQSVLGERVVVRLELLQRALQAAVAVGTDR